MYDAMISAYSDIFVRKEEITHVVKHVLKINKALNVDHAFCSEKTNQWCSEQLQAIIQNKVEI